MRRLVLFVSLFSCLCAHAKRSHTFGLDSYNRAFPTNRTDNSVFSPVAAELSTVVISETVDPLARADYAEALGAAAGYDVVYAPVVKQYRKGVENDFPIASARAFILPSVKQADANVRSMLFREYDVEFCSSRRHLKGTANWFRAKMDGAMEDFVLPVDKENILYYDLEYVRLLWPERFPKTGERLAFTASGGTVFDLPAFGAVRMASIWSKGAFTVFSMEMAGGARFFALTPESWHTLSEVRGMLTDDLVKELLATGKEKATTPSDYFNGYVSVKLPEVDILSETDLKEMIAGWKLRLEQFTPIIGHPAVHTARLRVRFRLDGSGLPPKKEVEKPAPVSNPTEWFANRAEKRAKDEALRSATRTYALDRPFVFFVVHESTATMPVVGTFSGATLKMSEFDL